ncbi:DUF3592 domain-containing protein [Pseudomonas sp. B21-015]|uniref:DUF3592 domain-containing protein n=1 Tax=Pseudomonas sp. B21-015 TaxID=2895473 RepID=UPI00215DEA87|nr:DUF3592 domain-containing protein [Pseudomonas sp. B21-015]UVM49533.1 DUF3592 domain-containing protein [Pseudomonas sp. B21-015]
MDEVHSRFVLRSDAAEHGRCRLQGYDFFDLRIRGVKAHAEVVSTSNSRIIGVQSGHSYTYVRKVAFVTAYGTPVIHEFRDEFSGVEAGDKVTVFHNPADPREVIPGTFSLWA